MLCHLAKKVLFAILIIYNANSTACSLCQNTKRDSHPLSKNLVEVLSISVNDFFHIFCLSFFSLVLDIWSTAYQLLFSFRGRSKKAAAMLQGDSYRCAYCVIKMVNWSMKILHSYSKFFTPCIFCDKIANGLFLGTITLINKSVLKRDK